MQILYVSSPPHARGRSSAQAQLEAPLCVLLLFTQIELFTQLSYEPTTSPSGSGDHKTLGTRLRPRVAVSSAPSAKSSRLSCAAGQDKQHTESQTNTRVCHFLLQIEKYTQQIRELEDALDEKTNEVL